MFHLGTLQLDLNNGSDFRGDVELPMPSAVLHQLLLTESLLQLLLCFQVKIVKKALPFLEKHSHTAETTSTKAHTCVWCRTSTVPHSFCRSVLVVAVQLGDAQHGLSEHSKEAQCFHKEGGVQPQVSDVTSHTSESEDALHVVCKLAPMPKIVQVKICNRTGMQEEWNVFSQPTLS